MQPQRADPAHRRGWLQPATPPSRDVETEWKLTEELWRAQGSSTTPFSITVFKKIIHRPIRRTAEKQHQKKKRQFRRRKQREEDPTAAQEHATINTRQISAAARRCNTWRTVPNPSLSEESNGWKWCDTESKQHFYDSK